MRLSLVYHAGALGDFLTTLPAMSVWRRLHPEARIFLLGVPALAALAPRGLFDEVWDARSSEFAFLYASAGDAGAPFSARLASFQSALLFSGASSPLSENLSRLGVTEIVRQDPFPPVNMHVVDYHLSLFPGRAVSEADRLPTIAVSSGALTVPPNTAALHSGSGDSKKNWPVSSFAGLAAGLEDVGFAVRWIVGPVEETLALPAGAQVWRKATLPDIAAALASCRLFVGNDSGISHLAAAAQCPTVTLFGPTDPGVWAPRGRSTRMIQAPQRMLSRLSVETVLSGCLRFVRL